MDTPPTNLLERLAAMNSARLAVAIGVHVTQLRRYEADTNQPTLEVLRALIEGAVLRHQARELAAS